MLLIKPFLGCNLHCVYCYERQYRKTKAPQMNYNLDAILRSMEEQYNVCSQNQLEMTLHGGEPLMLPKKDVRKILAKIKELTGQSGIQTNGTLIDKEHIKIFKEYNTHVGISYDGPGELSKYRGGASFVGKIFEKLIKEGLRTSLIMVVSKANAGSPRLLKKLEEYLLKVKRLGVPEGRLNPCGGAPGQELSQKRSSEVYLELADFCLHNNLKWSPFEDVINALQGKSRVCSFTGCDPFSTPSATVIVGDGTVTNCMRTNKADILLRHPAKYNTRNEILFATVQESGGCKGCKYWAACLGGCPTMAINDDWRNRTYLCPTWKSLFQFYENILSHFGISLCLGDFKNGNEEQKRVLRHEDSPHGDIGHGDVPHNDHVDSNHNDISPALILEHGDSHGDWSDHRDNGKASKKSNKKNGRLC